MSLDRRLLASALGIVLAVAACGGSSSSPSSPAGTGSAASPAAPTEVAPTEVAPTEVAPTDANSTAEPTGDTPSFVAGAAADLEAMLPDEANGVKFQKQSFDGASIAGTGMNIDSSQLDPVLKAHGKTLADVRVAMAGPADSSGTETALIIAFQVRGVDASEFLTAAGISTADLKPATIGGKQIQQAGTAGFSVIVYTKGDVLFEVLLASDALAAAIVEKLP